MKTTIFLLFIFFITNLSINKAQTKCALRAENASVIFNLKLGMTPKQVQNALGRAFKVKIKKSGEGTFFRNFIKKPAPPSLSNARALYLRFFKGELYQIEIFYENNPEWAILETFKSDLNNKFNLAPDAWRKIENVDKVSCDGVTLAADLVLNPRIELTDNDKQAEFEKAQAAKQSSKKRES